MKDSTSKKLLIIESLRGFAAIYVVIHHFISFSNLHQHIPSLLHFPFRFGQEIVILFFLMSGFVIYASNKNIEERRFLPYFKKRFARIYPIFILTLLLSCIVLYLNGEVFLKGDLQDFFGNLIMLQDTGDNKPGAMVYPFLKNYPLWSLSYEWWFYMLFFPLSLFIARTSIFKKIPSMYFITLISSVFWILYIFIPNHIFLVLSHLVIWWTGIAIAKIYYETGNLTFKSMRPIYISLVVITLLVIIPLIQAILSNKTKLDVNSFPIIDLRHFGFTLFAVFIGNLMFKYKAVNWNKLINSFSFFAPISYAMYCIHFPVILLQIPFIENELLILVVKLIIILVLSYIFEIILQPRVVNLFKYKNQFTLAISNDR